MMSGKLRSQSVLNDLSFESANAPPKVVSSIKYVNSNCNTVPPKVFNACLKLSLNHVFGETDDSERVFERIQEKCDSPIQVMSLFSHLIKITGFAVHQQSLAVKKEQCRKKLKDAGGSDDLCDKIIELIYDNEKSTEKNMIFKSSLPNLEEMRWRVNVAISTSSLNRVLEPTVVMEMKTSDGRVSTFEISMAKFHELRFGVSSLLKEMQVASKR